MRLWSGATLSTWIHVLLDGILGAALPAFRALTVSLIIVFKSSRWFNVDVVSAFGSLHHVDFDVSEIHTVSINMVEVRIVGQFPRIHRFLFLIEPQGGEQ
jgi:hypothetical protein